MFTCLGLLGACLTACMQIFYDICIQHVVTLLQRALPQPSPRLSLNLFPDRFIRDILQHLKLLNLFFIYLFIHFG